MEPANLTPTSVLAARVREMRSERQWSAEKLAKEVQQVGIPWNRGVVTKLETGHRDSVSVAELLALAYVFDVSPLSLLLPSEPGAYAITPNRVADSTIRIIDWMLGRAGAPFGEQIPDLAWFGIPSGLPEPLERREMHMAAERDRELNALRVRNAELEATLSTRPEISADTLVRLLRQAEELAEARKEMDAARAKELKLWRAIALYASDDVRKELRDHVPLSEILEVRVVDAEGGSTDAAEG